MFVLKHANYVQFLHSKGKQEDIQILKMVVHKKNISDPVIYVLTSCWAPSLHQAVDTCLRFFYLTAFIRLSIWDLI